MNDKEIYLNTFKKHYSEINNIFKNQYHDKFGFYPSELDITKIIKNKDKDTINLNITYWKTKIPECSYTHDIKPYTRARFIIVDMILKQLEDILKFIETDVKK
jgi:hypothetical protein